MSKLSLKELYISIIKKGYEPVLMANVKKIYSDTTKASFDCPISELPRIFRDSSVVENKEIIRPVHIGKLPAGYYDAQITSGKEGLCGKVLTIVEPSIKVIQCNESDEDKAKYIKRYTVPFPKLALLFSIRDNYVDNTMVFAIKAKVLKENTRLYNYPFSNVDIEDGRLCWGTVRIPKVEKLKDVDEVTRAFFESVNNVDHFSRETTTLHYDTLSGLLKYISNESEFPNKILTKSEGKYKKIEDLLRKIRSV